MTMYQVMRAQVPPALTADTEVNTLLGEVPVSGVVSGISLVSGSTVAPNGTNNRAFAVLNRGNKDGAGTGTTSVATVDTSATGFTDNVERDMTLSGTPANLAVVKGDILELVETTPGTGVAHTGFLCRIQITPS